MAPSSPVASSSTLPTSVLPLPQPGKSILKKPHPPQSRFFSISTFSKLLPNPTLTGSSTQAAPPLKRAHFILPNLQTVYSISTASPPSSPTLAEERRLTEQRELERRRSVVRGNSCSSDRDSWWSTEKLEVFYRECCRGREEEPLPPISAALKTASVINHARTVDISGVHLTPYAAKAFGDVLSIEWGLRKLVLRDCNLDELTLRPILHALLITNTISFLSIAANRKMKSTAWRILGAFIADVSSLQFLDISNNVLDKKSVEYLVASFKASPLDVTLKANGQTDQTLANKPSVLSLRLDDCSLRPGTLEVLAPAIRPSTLRNLSLRHNKIASTGGVALALIIKDYPDTIAPQSSTPSPPASPMSPTIPLSDIGLLPNHLRQANGINGSASNTQTTTTYTPYIPKSRRPQRPLPIDTSGKAYPLITSSAQGGVTTRHSTLTGPSATLLDNIRALDNLPRLGCLRTLDLRGNDIRGGVSYIAQVLKRNRTLKVLNLSENRLDMTGLLAIAEALKYNSSLETLDLSRNPCCGPELAGVTSLRTAFTLNSSLKRLFLSATSLTSDGAIALAEFLPESRSLYHLDLTNNSNLDLAGIVALNAGLKKNTVMRCLDLDIPPGHEEFSRLCREILNSCIRNTEAAEETLRRSTDPQDAGISGRGLGKGVWGMIEESVLARSLREKDGRETYSPLLEQAQISLSAVEFILQKQVPIPEGDDNEVALAEAHSVQAQLSDAISTLPAGFLLETLLTVNDSLLEKLVSVRKNISLQSGERGRPSLDPRTRVESPTSEELSPRVDKGKGRAEPEPDPVHEPEFETFKVGDSDEEGEDNLRREVTSLSLGGLPPNSPERMVVPSPIERSRLWVEEEGEIFRKGQALLEPEDLESEYAGEQLRIELLEAQVERPPQRQINEDEDSLEPVEAQSDISSPRIGSPVISPIQRPSWNRTNSFDTK